MSTSCTQPERSTFLSCLQPPRPETDFKRAHPLRSSCLREGHPARGATSVIWLQSARLSEARAVQFASSVRSFRRCSLERLSVCRAVQVDKPFKLASHAQPCSCRFCKLLQPSKPEMSVSCSHQLK